MLLKKNITCTKKNFSHLRVAIVADWLTEDGGAEKVLRSFLRIFPQAEVFTSVYIPENFDFLSNTKVHTTSLQKLPTFFKKKHQILFPFLPKAIEELDFSGFDLVLSSSTFIAKGVITDIDVFHLCYCHTPTRYFWDEWQYFLKDGLNIPQFLRPFKRFFPAMFTTFRIWDFVSAQRPDAYIGNSEYVVGRIKKYYRRKAHLLRPPVNWEYFSQGRKYDKKNFYIALGRLIPYKKFDLLVKTFKHLPNKKLIIVGKGPELKYLKSLAKNAKNIVFVGFVSQKKLLELLGSAKAFLFPQNEDAGIAPMEALCTGTPCIAFKKGGALGIVNDKNSEKIIKNGVFFEKQTVTSLTQAIFKFEKDEKYFLKKRKEISDFMKKYSTENFEKNLKKLISIYKQ